MRRCAFVVVASLILSSWQAAPCLANEPAAQAATADEVLIGLRRFYRQTARPDGSFQPGGDPDYAGMSDSAYSDLAPATYACTIHKTFGWTLPYEEKTVAFLKSRQRPNGDFFNVAGTVDPQSPEGRTYNTTQGLVALRALGERPAHDPLPVFEAILKEDYKTLPAYSTSFFPLAYLCAGKPIPEKADRSIRALMVQDETGYLNDHIAATFHASHYYSLVGEPTPKARQMVDRILRDQKPDGGWMLNMPSRDRHAGFDAVFTLTHEGSGREDCRAAVRRAAQWALSCRNDDGGFGHFPGSPSDADAVYFQVGTLVLAGFLKPADPLPKDPHLLSWGHLLPVRERADGTRRIVLPEKGWIGGVTFSPDGRTLATASSDKQARLWDVATGKMTAELAGHQDAVVAVAFSPDGKLLATASHDGTARVWNANFKSDDSSLKSEIPNSKSELSVWKPLHTLRGHRGGVATVAFAQAGGLLATGGLDGTIALWNAAAGEPLRTIRSHRSWVNGVAFTPDGRSLVSGSSDGTVKVWSIPEGELQRTIPATSAEVRSIAVSPDGKCLAAGIRYGKLKLWSTEDWSERWTIDGHEGDVWAVAFTADSRQLVSGDGDWNRAGVVKLWDVETGKPQGERKHTGEVLGLAVSRDGRLAAAGGDGAASIWDERTLAEADMTAKTGGGANDGLRKAVTFYASFDEEVRGDVGGGPLTPDTRFNHPAEAGQFVFEKGFNRDVFRIAKGKGISGGALEALEPLPRNGRIFFPGKGNLPFKPDGWSGAVSFWCNTDPNERIKSPFCDPIQITQKGANNGGLWFDFNNAKPRDSRHGAFPAVAAGQTAIKEEDPNAPMVRVPGIPWKTGEWHHVVLNFQNLDTGKPDAVSSLYLDGKLIGEVKGRAIAMAWDLDKTGIYVAVNYVGLLDELVIFNRALSADEVQRLHEEPGLIAGLKPEGAKKEGAANREPDAKGEADATDKAAGLQSGGLRGEVEALLADKPSADSPRVRDLRKKLTRALSVSKDPGAAETCLELLLQLPRGEFPFKTPKFPFDAGVAGRYQSVYAAWLGVPVEWTNAVGIRLVLIPPGTFLMGSPEDEPGHNADGLDETRHSVTLTRPMYLGVNEITFGQFRRFVEATKYQTDGEKYGGGNAHDERAEWKHRPGTHWRNPGYAGPFKQRDDHPVVHVSHADCRAFCDWLNRAASDPAREGPSVRYDLPTEAQWEWACRAGSAARFWWGNDEDATGKVANVGDQSLKRVHPDWPRTIMPMDDGHAFPAPVGSYRANAFGLHDMLGNVWEFCSTHYGPYPREATTDPPDGDPQRGFAVRGGGWSNIARDARCATRNADPPHFCHSNLGFRVRLSLP